MIHILNETIITSKGFKWIEKDKLDENLYVTKYSRGKDTLTYKFDGEIHTWQLIINGTEIYNDILLNDESLEELLNKYLDN